MSTLQARLDRIKREFLTHAAPEGGQVIARATEELRDSGIMERLPEVGSMLPPFELPDTEGRTITSAELLGKGPLIISFYRGVW